MKTKNRFYLCVYILLSPFFILRRSIDNFKADASTEQALRLLHR